MTRSRRCSLIACLLSLALSTPTSVEAVVRTSPFQFQVIGIRSVDDTGRFAIVEALLPATLGSRILRVDRVTGSFSILGTHAEVSGDLTWAIVFDDPVAQGVWKNLLTGEVAPVAIAGAATASMDMSRDGSVAIVNQGVYTRTGQLVVPSVITWPKRVSANGRYIIGYSDCGDLCRRWAIWDLATGSVRTLYSSTSRAAISVADDGSVIEFVVLEGTIATGGPAEYVRRFPNGRIVRFLDGTEDPFQQTQWSDDSSTYVARRGSQLAWYDTATGFSATTPMPPNTDHNFRVSVSGRVALLQPQFPAAAEPVTVASPFAAPPSRVAAREVLTLPVAGIRGVPSNATSAALNITATNPAGPGFITAWPCDQPQPTTSNLNFTTGQTIPNLVITKLSATGTVCLYTHASADIIVDVQGYFTGTTYNGLTPDRYLDTRD
jgi:hypothetical protein